MPDELSKAIDIADQRCQKATPWKKLIMFMGGILPQPHASFTSADNQANHSGNNNGQVKLADNALKTVQLWETSDTGVISP